MFRYFRLKQLTLPIKNMGDYNKEQKRKDFVFLNCTETSES